MDVPPLTSERVMQGGWNPTYARVLSIEQNGPVAAAVVDGNGDGVELELESWSFEGGGWTCGTSGGFGGLLPRKGEAAIGWGRGVCRGGIAEPGTTVMFEWHGQRGETEADAYGIWLIVVPFGEDDDPLLDQPEVIGYQPPG